MKAGGGAPLFLLSFRHKDDGLSETLNAAGWQVFAARRVREAEAQFLASGASVALVDLRAADEEAAAMLRALADVAETNEAALLAIVDTEPAGPLHLGGATHFLREPFTDDDLVQAVRFAERFAERVTGGRRRATQLLVNEEGAPPGRDPLTGVRDGRTARAWLEEQLGQGNGTVVALLIAVSRFDAINAAFDRTTGDALLQAAVRRIERLVETEGKVRLVARLAGPEFTVLLGAPASLAEGRFLADQLIEALGKPFVSGDHLVTLGSHIGIAESIEGDEAAALLRRASAALAEAKEGEGAPVRVVEAGRRRPGERKEKLDVDLRRALDEDRIDILFQPQMSVATGSMIGAEALARWRHPTLGGLGAVTLFNVAERSDYLVQLSEHVQRKALALAAAWPGALKTVRLSVNITAADIVRPGFASQFLRMIGDNGFDPARLTVEVTESGLIEDLGAAATLLAELREGGLRIAIDDFGTGYSSLAYLKALPVDYLKIDKRLSEDITGSARDRVVVRGVIDMARSLGLDVIAEGVETQEQLDLLAQEGCTIYQGFLCSEPVDGAALERLISR